MQSPQISSARIPLDAHWTRQRNAGERCLMKLSGRRNFPSEGLTGQTMQDNLQAAKSEQEPLPPENSQFNPWFRYCSREFTLVRQVTSPSAFSGLLYRRTEG